MYKKRLRNRPFKTSGPLQKMIEEAVEERMSALKSRHDWEKISSETTELDMSKDPRYESGTTTTDTFKRQGQDDPYEGEKIDSDTWQKLYDEAMQGGGSKGMQEYVKKYNIDGTAKAEYKQETTTDLKPAELEKIKEKEIELIDTPDEPPTMEPVKREEGSMNLAQILGQNPDQVMTSNASDFFNTEFSSDNPTFDVLKDPKFTRKARKEYEKFIKQYSPRKRQSMPFNRYLMQIYQPKGMDSNLIDQARQWEGDNAGDTDSSGEGGAVNREIAGAKDTAEARYKAGPDDWKNTVRQTGQGQPPAQMSRPMAKMLKGRTMAFRKINMNQAPGFKMKRK